MSRLAALQCLLQTALGLSSDLGAATLLSYSTAVERELWGGRQEEAVGQSQKYEQFLPPPPGFRADGLQTFGRRQTVSSSLDPNTAAVVSQVM